MNVFFSRLKQNAAYLVVRDICFDQIRMVWMQKLNYWSTHESYGKLIGGAYLFWRIGS